MEFLDSKGHPSRVSFLFCCDSVGIDPLERKAFGYGFVTLLRPSLWEACKTEQIPVQNLDGSMPERFLYSGDSYEESHPATYVAGFAFAARRSASLFARRRASKYSRSEIPVTYRHRRYLALFGVSAAE